MIIPGKETQGKSISQPKANKASKQNADKNTMRNEDVDYKFEPEVDKAYQKKCGSNKAGNDTRENHDSNAGGKLRAYPKSRQRRQNS